MSSRPRLRDAGRFVARRLALQVLDRVVRTAERLAVRLGVEAPRPLRPSGSESASGSGSESESESESGSESESESGSESESESGSGSESASGSSADRARPTLGWGLVEVLGRRCGRAVATLRAELHPGDPGSREPVHDLRVATRRLRAFLSVYAPLLEPKTARRLRRRLRRITRAAGEIRQWDAHLELAAPLLAELTDPLERAAMEHVIEWVHGRREQAADEVGDRLDAGAREKLADRLDLAIDAVSARLLREGDGAGPLVRRFAADALREAADRAGPPVVVENVEAMHGVRIAAKRARYALELLRPALDQEYRATRRPAKRAQEAIGLHHDAALLESLLRGRAQALAAHGHLTLAGALDDLAARAAVQRRAAYERAQPWLARWAADRVRTDADRISPPPPPPPGPVDPASAPDASAADTS